MLRSFLQQCVYTPVLAVLLMLGMVLGPFLPSVYALETFAPPDIIVNGQPIHPDVGPLIENDRILVPARAIAEVLGARVDWQEEQQQVTIIRGDTQVTLWIGNNRALKGSQEIGLDAAPRIVSDRTLVPLRFVAEALGAQVEWRPDTREVIINMSPAGDPLDESGDVSPGGPEDSTENGTEQGETSIDDSGVYNEPGTYGPDEGVQEVAGDVSILSGDITLQNQEISGDLTIAGSPAGFIPSINRLNYAQNGRYFPGAGSGAVSLNNVTVKGTVFINGGNSTLIMLNDFNCRELCVNNPLASVQIKLQGNSSIPRACLQSGAELEENQLTDYSQGFKEVVINGASGLAAILYGQYSKVSCSSPGADVQLLSGAIAELIIENAASGSSVYISKDSTVDRCLANGMASLRGSGYIDNLAVFTEGTVRYNSLQVGSTTSGPGLYPMSDSEKINWKRQMSNTLDIGTSDSAPSGPLTATAPGGEDQILYNGSLALSSNYADTTWAIANYEDGGASLSSVVGATVNILGPAAPGGSGTGSSGRCVVTASHGGSSVQYTVYIQGNGTQAFPYIIRNGAGLTGMRDNAQPGNVDNDGLGHDISGYDGLDFYKMTADISLAAYQPWTPIDLQGAFTSGGTADGTEYLRFNGYGHHISSLVVNGTAIGQGLFKTINANSGDYLLANLVLDTPLISNTANYTGALAGSVYGNTGQVRLSNVQVIGGSISGASYTGGMVGYASKATTSNSWASASVSAAVTATGGLLGSNDNGSTVSNCHAIVPVINGSGRTGGLVGYNGASSIVSNCYASGAVNGSGYVGGLVGYNNNFSTISNCYASVQVSGSTIVGGLVGYNVASSTISKCYASGSVNGLGNNTGGLVGASNQASIISNCYASGPVTGTGSNAGGLVGNSTASTVNNCYASGVVIGMNGVNSGLVGTNVGSTISNCAALGPSVTGIVNNHRLSGSMSGLGATQTNNFALSTMTVNGSTLVSADASSLEGKDVTVNDAQTQARTSNFYTTAALGWDGDTIWIIQDGSYPALRNMP